MDGGAEVTLVRFLRLSDAPPPAREVLEVARDGSFSAWRSIHAAVGRFAGSVPDPAGLRRLVEAVADSSPPRAGSLPLDATVDTVKAGDRELEVGANGSVDGPWGELLEACRALVAGVDFGFTKLVLWVFGG